MLGPDGRCRRAASIDVDIIKEEQLTSQQSGEDNMGRNSKEFLGITRRRVLKTALGAGAVIGAPAIIGRAPISSARSAGPVRRGLPS